MDKEERKTKSRIIETLIITVALLVGYRLEISPFTEVVLGLFVISAITYYLLTQLNIDGIEGLGLRGMGYMTAGLFAFSIVSYYSLLADAFEALEVWYIASVIWLLTYANLTPQSDLESLKNHGQQILEKLDRKEETFRQDLRAAETLKARLNALKVLFNPVKIPEYYVKHIEWILILLGTLHSLWVVLTKESVLPLPIIWIMIITSILIVSLVRRVTGYFEIKLF